MILVDSVGWIDFLSDGPLASQYEKHLHSMSEVVVPTIVLYEVYKKFRREQNEKVALMVFVKMQMGQLIHLTEQLALQAADVALQFRLSMVDAIVYATALQEKAKVVTSDKDLKDLPEVIYYQKSSYKAKKEKF